MIKSAYVVIVILACPESLLAQRLDISDPGRGQDDVAYEHFTVGILLDIRN